MRCANIVYIYRQNRMVIICKIYSYNNADDCLTMRLVLARTNTYMETCHFNCFRLYTIFYFYHHIHFSAFFFLRILSAANVIIILFISHRINWFREKILLTFTLRHNKNTCVYKKKNKTTFLTCSTNKILKTKHTSTTKRARQTDTQRERHTQRKRVWETKSDEYTYTHTHTHAESESWATYDEEPW